MRQGRFWGGGIVHASLKGVKYCLTYSFIFSVSRESVLLIIRPAAITDA